MRETSTQLYLQVKQSLLEQIRQGQWREGERIPTHKALARTLGVSEGTVSRAVSELTREGLLAARRRKGVQVLDAQTVKSSGAVAFLTNLTPDALEAGGLNPLLHTLWAALQQRMGRRGYEVTTIPALSGVEAGAEWLPVERLRGRHFSSLAVMNIHDLEYLARLKTLSAPVVVMDRDTLDIGLDCVVFDNLGTSFLLTRHLLGLGHRAIAFAGMPWPETGGAMRIYDPATSERWHGYRLALEAAGLPYREELVAFSPATGNVQGRSVTQALLERGVPFTALVSEYDHPRVWETLRAAGRGESVTVAGWRWDRPADPAAVPFDAYIWLDLGAMAETAAALLERKMDRRSPRVERVIVPGALQRVRERGPFQ